MRISYNILWIEDELGWFKGAKSLVEEIIEESGFNAVIKSYSTEKSAIEFINNNDLQIFDLILVDFKIGNDEIGNILIESIRSYNIYTEVIFYSSNLEKIREVIHAEKVDGVYCASRTTDDFIYKVEKVFNTTVKKSQDISSIRGLMLSETADLDNTLREIAVSFINTQSKENQNIVRNYILNNLVNEWKETNAKNEEKLKALSNEDLVNNPFLEAAKRMRVVGKILEIINNESLVNKKVFCREYETEIINIRNILAHCVEVELDNKKVLLTKKGGKTFDTNTFMQLRKDILKHTKQLEAIKKYFLQH